MLFCMDAETCFVFFGVILTLVMEDITFILPPSPTFLPPSANMYGHMCVCVCVCARESERKRESEIERVRKREREREINCLRGIMIL